MNRLVTTEAARWFARTLLWVVSAATIALMVLGPVSAWQGSREPSDADRAHAQAQVDEYVPPPQEDIDACLADEAREREASGDPALDFGCDWEPKVEDYLPWRLYWDIDGSDVLWGFVTFLVLAAVLAGASFVAAEFSTGAIGNWLTFAPRRGRVLASKLVATALGFAPTAIVAVAVLVAGTWGAFAVNGALRTPNGLGDRPDFTLADAVASGGRIVLLALVFAVLGAALGFLLRHTAAVLGAVLAWTVVVEGLGLALIPALRPWVLQTNINAWVRDGVEWHEDICASGPPTAGQDCEPVVHVVSMGHGAAVLATALIVVVALAAVAFRRRDVS